MPFELKNSNVIFISIVRAGANRREAIYKFEAAPGSAPQNFEREILIRKSDDARQIVYGIVYPAGDATRADTQGDFASAAEVEAMSHRFMAQGRTANGVDRDHSYQTLKGVYIAESWIVRSGDPIFGSADDIGAWAVGIKIEEPALYAELKAAGYHGLSMAGVAERVEVQKSVADGGDGKNNGGWLAKFLRLLGKEDKEMDELKKALDALALMVKGLGEKIAELEKAKPAEPGDAKPADLTKSITDLSALVKGLETKVAGLEKAKTEDGKTQTGGETDLAKSLTDLTALVKGLGARVDAVEKIRIGSKQPETTATTQKGAAIGIM